MNYTEFSHQLDGHWREILNMYGIEVPHIKGQNSKNGACPLCGGDDRAHWREADGRLCLYCRHCTNGSMKSPEDVIQEFSGVGFREFCDDMINYLGISEDKTKSKPMAKRPNNAPKWHRQNQAKSEQFWQGLDGVSNHRIFNRYGTQYPYDVRAKSNAVFFDIRTPDNFIVNVFTVFDKDGIQKSFLAGDMSAGAWHTIPMCRTRKPSGVIWVTSITEGCKQWWQTGKEIRVTFTLQNMQFLLERNYFQIDDHNEVVMATPKDLELMLRAIEYHKEIDEIIKKSVADKAA